MHYYNYSCYAKTRYTKICSKISSYVLGLCVSHWGDYLGNNGNDENIILKRWTHANVFKRLLICSNSAMHNENYQNMHSLQAKLVQNQCDVVPRYFQNINPTKKFRDSFEKTSTTTTDLRLSCHQYYTYIPASTIEISTSIRHRRRYFDNAFSTLVDSE